MTVFEMVFKTEIHGQLEEGGLVHFDLNNPGVYFVHAVAGEMIATERVVVIRSVEHLE
ncbi:MAG: hypothetical protein KAQ97_02235 [Candidatus Fermentibacteraceae bacterium]|nr:hypothetical protein [Candidatus Fermentibacteraceae bacterium]